MDKLSRLVGGDRAGTPEPIFDKEVNANIENALTLLEEFHCMMEMIRDESREITEDVLSSFRATNLKLQTLYPQICDLERLVKHVEGNCSMVEKSLEQVENQSNMFSVFKNTLKRAISSEMKAASSPREAQTQYSSPDVFVTSELITVKDDTKQDN